MFDELIATSQDFDERKSDYGPRQVDDFYFGDFDQPRVSLIVPEDLFGGATQLQPTDWAFSQVCRRLGSTVYGIGSHRSLPRDYMLAQPQTWCAEQLNHWIKLLPQNRKWFVRAIDDECRAVLTDRYASVDVTDTLKWVQAAIDSKGGIDGVELHNPVVTPDALHLQVLWPTIETDEGAYKIGGYFRTGEIGNYRVQAFPLIQRTSCYNSIVVPADSFTFEHIHSGNPHIIKRLFVDAIFMVLQGAAEMLEKLMEAQDAAIPDYSSFVTELCQNYGWQKETRDAILMGAEGHESLFGVVNGISAAAQNFGQDERAEMEIIAGKVLLNARI